MCGRYAIFSTASELATYFNLTNSVDFGQNFNAAPSQNLPVIIKDRIGLAKWGYTPAWAEQGYKGPKPINARAETVCEKPMFRDSFSRRRCLIPANGFFEWLSTTQGGKIPYFISKNDQDILAFAGIWSKYENIVSFGIIVRSSLGPMAEIHDRMPVIIMPEDIKKWFTGDTAEAKALLDKNEACEKLDVYEVSKEVNSVQNNYESLVEPVNQS